MRRRINMLRQKANEVSVRICDVVIFLCFTLFFWLIVYYLIFFACFLRNSQANAKLMKDPEPINFGAYKQKLRFTSSAVDALEVCIFRCVL
jgi:hypothetical protein